MAQHPNIFDQFDEDQDPPVTNVFDQFDDPSFVQEIPGSIASGALLGVTGVLGIPATIATSLEAAGAEARTQDPVSFGAGGIEGFIGGSGDSLSTGLGEALSPQGISGAITSVTGEPTRPVTGLGKFLEAAVEFGTGFAVPGGIAGKIAGIPRALGQGAVAGVGAEAGRQLAEGTDFEGAAQLGGALIGATGPSGVAALARRRAAFRPSEVTQAAERIGVDLPRGATGVGTISPRVAAPIADVAFLGTPLRRAGGKATEQLGAAAERIGTQLGTGEAALAGAATKGAIKTNIKDVISARISAKFDAAEQFIIPTVRRPLVNTAKVAQNIITR